MIPFKMHYAANCTDLYLYFPKISGKPLTPIIGDGQAPTPPRRLHVAGVHRTTFSELPRPLCGGRGEKTNAKSRKRPKVRLLQLKAR